MGNLQVDFKTERTIVKIIVKNIEEKKKEKIEILIEEKNKMEMESPSEQKVDEKNKNLIEIV
jgi:hypothetical protein